MAAVLGLEDLRGNPRRRRREALIRRGFLAAAVLAVVINAAILLSLLDGVVEFFDQLLSGPGLGSLWNPTGWFPRRNLFDVKTVFVGTVIISVIAMLVAAPLGLGAAMYLSEYAGRRARRILKPILEVLAGVPSVVMAYFVVSFISPDIVQRMFSGATFYNMLGAGLGVGILISPIVASVAEDAMHAVPLSLREASYGLGARRKGTAIRVVFPAAVSGIVAALILIAEVLGTAVQVFSQRGTGFLTSNLSSLPERVGVAQGIVGSLRLMGFVIVLSFPLGIGAAVYLEEYARDNRFTRFLNSAIRNLAGVPSVVYGLLGLAIFVQLFASFTGGRSLMSGGLTMAILVLPIVIITSSEAIRAVPVSIREAGFGVGATRWEVVRSHVLPYAAPGVLTGTILALARALGEAAPLLLIGGAPTFFSAGSRGFVETLQGEYTALPAIIFTWSRKSLRAFGDSTAAAIVVLLAVLLLINATAIYLRNRYERKW